MRPVVKMTPEAWEALADLVRTVEILDDVTAERDVKMAIRVRRSLIERARDLVAEVTPGPSMRPYWSDDHSHVAIADGDRMVCTHCGDVLTLV